MRGEERQERERKNEGKDSSAAARNAQV